MYVAALFGLPFFGSGVGIAALTGARSLARGLSLRMLMSLLRRRPATIHDEPLLLRLRRHASPVHVRCAGFATGCYHAQIRKAFRKHHGIEDPADWQHSDCAVAVRLSPLLLCWAALFDLSAGSAPRRAQRGYSGNHCNDEWAGRAGVAASYQISHGESTAASSVPVSACAFPLQVFCDTCALCQVSPSARVDCPHPSCRPAVQWSELHTSFQRGGPNEMKENECVCALHAPSLRRRHVSSTFGALTARFWLGCQWDRRRSERRMLCPLLLRHPMMAARRQVLVVEEHTRLRARCKASESGRRDCAGWPTERATSSSPLDLRGRAAVRGTAGGSQLELKMTDGDDATECVRHDVRCTLSCSGTAVPAPALRQQHRSGADDYYEDAADRRRRRMPPLLVVAAAARGSSRQQAWLGHQAQLPVGGEDDDDPQEEEGEQHNSHPLELLNQATTEERDVTSLPHTACLLSPLLSHARRVPARLSRRATRVVTPPCPWPPGQTGGPLSAGCSACHVAPLSTSRLASLLRSSASSRAFPSLSAAALSATNSSHVSAPPGRPVLTKVTALTPRRLWLRRVRRPTACCSVLPSATGQAKKMCDAV